MHKDDRNNHTFNVDEDIGEMGSYMAVDVIDN